MQPRKRRRKFTRASSPRSLQAAISRSTPCHQARSIPSCCASTARKHSEASLKRHPCGAWANRRTSQMSSRFSALRTAHGSTVRTFSRTAASVENHRLGVTFAGKSEVAIPQQEDAQAELLAKYDQPASKPGSRNDEPQSDHGSRPHSRRSEGSPFFPRCNGDPQVTEGAPEQARLRWPQPDQKLSKAKGLQWQRTGPPMVSHPNVLGR